MPDIFASLRYKYLGYFGLIDRFKCFSTTNVHNIDETQTEVDPQLQEKADEIAMNAIRKTFKPSEKYPTFEDYYKNEICVPSERRSNQRLKKRLQGSDDIDDLIPKKVTKKTSHSSGQSKGL